MAAEQRVFFCDVKPYEIPDDLSTLQGPTGGEVVLSHSVLWAPEAAGSISTAGTARLGLPCGVIRGDFMFRIPTLRWADTHGPRTWTYDFRWASPALGMAFHCLDLPFTWDLLGAEGVTAVAGPNPPQDLADEIHAAWVRFIATGDPGWSAWNGHNPHVFTGEQTDVRAEPPGGCCPVAEPPSRSAHNSCGRETGSHWLCGRPKGCARGRRTRRPPEERCAQPHKYLDV